jgi:hypothetical protein
MSERSCIDTVDAYAVEPQDYVRFPYGMETREGSVLAVEDHGDTVTLVLSDDLEGDTIAYDVPALSSVEILSYVSFDEVA